MLACKTFRLLLAVTCGTLSCHAAEPRLQDVLAAVTANLNEDGEFDRALLVQGDDGTAGLRVYLSTKSGENAAMTLALDKPAFVFAGPMWGQLPELGVGTKGALVVTSRNSAIGRNKWEQKLTIVYRKADFLIAGVTYDAYDTLDPKASHRCDVNLLSGTAVRDGRTTKGPPRMLRVMDWADDKLPKECEF